MVVVYIAAGIFNIMVIRTTIPTITTLTTITTITTKPTTKPQPQPQASSPTPSCRTFATSNNNPLLLTHKSTTLIIQHHNGNSHKYSRSKINQKIMTILLTDSHSANLTLIL